MRLRNAIDAAVNGPSPTSGTNGGRSCGGSAEGCAPTCLRPRERRSKSTGPQRSQAAKAAIWNACIVSRIAVGRTVRTGIAVETAAAHAGAACSRVHMREAGRVVESSGRVGVDRAGIQARFSDTCVAKMHRFINLGKACCFVEAAARRDRHATARRPDASVCPAATVSASRRASPIAETADRACRKGIPRLAPTCRATPPMISRAQVSSGSRRSSG